MFLILDSVLFLSLFFIASHLNSQPPSSALSLSLFTLSLFFLPSLLHCGLSLFTLHLTLVFHLYVLFLTYLPFSPISPPPFLSFPSLSSL